MTAVQPPSIVAEAPPSKRGRGLIRWGAALIALSIVGGIVGTVLTIGQVDFNEFNRDVVIHGDSSVAVPGSIDFEVDEPLGSGGDAEMYVGIGIDPVYTNRPSCVITDADGTRVSGPTDSNTAFYSTDSDTDWTVIESGRVGSGLFTATCDASAAGQTSPVMFTVGRTDQDLFGDVGGIFAWLGVGAVAGSIFVLGLVLLIVGLVQRNKAKRPPWNGGQPPGWQPQPGWNQPHPGWYQPQPGWGPPPPGQPPGWYPPGPGQPPPYQPPGSGLPRPGGAPAPDGSPPDGPTDWSPPPPR